VRERKAVQALSFVYNNETQECRDGATADRQAGDDRDRTAAPLAGEIAIQ